MESSKSASDITLVKTYLKAALNELSTGMIAVRTVNRFAEEVPALFCRAAISLLQEDLTPEAARYLSLVLLNVPGFYADLVRTSQKDQKATRIVLDKLIRAERLLDVKLARQLPPRYSSGSPETLRGNLAEGALDLLDKISEGRRLVPVIIHLAQNADPRLSAKATLVVGRRIQSVAWSEQALGTCTDPRVRANAIEALWGIDTEPARRLLSDCLRDGNNRVVGNAVLGLHLAGQQDVSAKVAQLANYADAPFRATAAWAMGKIANPTLIPDLSRLIKDEVPMVRTAALRAVINLRQSEVKKRAIEVNGPPAKIAEELADATAAAASETRLEPEAAVPPLRMPQELIETVVHLDGRHHATFSQARRG